jgi:hypothetical protein
MTNPFKTTLIALAICVAALAQQTVAPTTEPVGSTRGKNWEDYNIVNSFEAGYRFHTVGGDMDSYRSTVNYGNGIRLLGSSLSIHSREGHGHYFDELTLTTQGLGNDPYEAATLRIAKNRLYRYDLIWRENDYFNPGLRTGGATSPHLLDTSYTSQDHDLTLFPQSNFRFFLGYSRGHQDGPALSTVQLFNATGNEFPLFTNVRRLTNEFRVGSELTLFGFRLNWLHGWQDFKEDTTFDSGSNAGLNANNVTTLTSFQRREPYHGTSPYWRVGLFTDRHLISFNGRFTYTAGKRDFVLNEGAVGLGRFGAAQNQQIVTAGDANRPVATGNATVSLYPFSRLTIVNSTSVYNTRIDGNSGFLQFNNATLTADFQSFQYLAIRLVANETDLNFQLAPRVGFYAGYNYTNRLIRSIEEVTVSGTPQSKAVNQTNQLSSGTTGIRLRPIKPLTVAFEGEIGRADTPFTPLSDRNYHVLGARAQYKAKNLTLTVLTRANYNVNSTTLATYGSHSRNYSATGVWTPRDWLSFDASYSKLHLNTVGAIAYFAAGEFVRGQQSFYFSNIHSGNLGARFALKRWADLYVGYNHVRDTGDGRSNAFGGSPTGAISIFDPTGTPIPALAAFHAAQTFPLTYQSPLARLSVRINERLRWNAGYQYYALREQFFAGQNFRAHTGYTSLLWSF